MRSAFLFFIVTSAFSPILVAETAAEDSAAAPVLREYLTNNRKQQDRLRGLSMHVEIEAKLTRFGKVGTLKALRSISKIGQITYRALTFQGDDTIKKDIIARYMTAEVEAANHTGLGITEENYKFRYYGQHGQGDWRLHLFEVTPREKKVGLFQGWVWVEARTLLPVREQGEFVKNPSVFLRKVTFVRDYVIRDGIAFPSHIESSVDTRLVGRAEVNIYYSNYAPSADGVSHARLWTAAEAR